MQEFDKIAQEYINLLDDEANENLDLETNQAIDDDMTASMDNNEQDEFIIQEESETDFYEKESIKNTGVIDIDRPVNLKELITEQGSLLKNLDEKAKRLESMNFDKETKGLLIDFRIQLSELNEKTIKLLDYFGENISSKDRALINRTLLLKQNLAELYDLIKYFESKGYIQKTQEFEKKFKRLIKASKERVDSFENNLKKALDSNLPIYNDILKLFIQRQNELLDNLFKEVEQKTSIFSKDLDTKIKHSKESIIDLNSTYEVMGKKVKNFALAMLVAFTLFGLLFGVLSVLIYQKYKEYQAIEKQMQSISAKINNISVRKDENNNLILSIPKNNTNIDNDKDKFYITIKEANLR